MSKTLSVALLLVVVLTSSAYILSQRNSTPAISPTDTQGNMNSTPNSNGASGTAPSIADTSCNDYSRMNLPADYDQFKEVNPEFSKKNYNSVTDLRGGGMCGMNGCGTKEADKLLPKLFPKGIPDNVTQMSAALRDNHPYGLYSLFTNPLSNNDVGSYSMIIDERNYQSKLYYPSDSLRYPHFLGAAGIDDGDRNYSHFALFTHHNRIYYYRGGDKTFHLIASSTLSAPETYFGSNNILSVEKPGDIFIVKTYSCNDSKKPLRTLTFNLSAIDAAQSAASSTYR